MITLDEARENIGRTVIYQAPHPGAKLEVGVISSVNCDYIFVRYGEQTTAQATRPDDLRFQFDQ